MITCYPVLYLVVSEKLLQIVAVSGSLSMYPIAAIFPYHLHLLPTIDST